MEGIHGVISLAATQDIDGPGIGGLVGDAACFGQGLGQGQAPVVGGNGTRPRNLAHEIDR